MPKIRKSGGGGGEDVDWGAVHYLKMALKCSLSHIPNVKF